MPCCGKKRTAVIRKTEKPANPSASFETKPELYFEYTGATALTVIGPVTRMRYYFKATGDRQRVDERDAAGLMAVPMLQKIS